MQPINFGSGEDPILDLDRCDALSHLGQMVQGIMLAASQLVRTDGHVRPDLVLRAVSPRIQRWMEVINCVAAIAFCAVLAWYGWSIVVTSWQLDERSSSDLQPPAGGR